MRKLFALTITAVVMVAALLTGGCNTRKDLTPALAKQLIQDRIDLLAKDGKMQGQVESIDGLVLDTETTAECTWSGSYHYGAVGNNYANEKRSNTATFHRQPDGAWVCTGTGVMNL